MDFREKVSPFRTETREKKNKPGCWSSTIVKIYEGDKYLGEYERSYPSYAESTFYPFEIEGKGWFALYSADYTCTRIMKLPECKDIGGEKGSATGFCPVELFIPFYIEVESRDMDGEPIKYRLNNLECFDKEELTVKNGKYSKLKFYNWGLVAGCVWGDDTSWKIQHLDLSQAHKGILTRTQKFGYFEMGDDMTLIDSINISDYEDDQRIDLLGKTNFDLAK